MEQLNLDPNGELNYSEFIAATLDKNQYLNPDSLWAEFKYFDIDNRNFITNKNLRDALVGFLILINNTNNNKLKITKKKTQKGQIRKKVCKLGIGSLDQGN